MERFLQRERRRTVTVLGYFDGVHRGHRALLSAARTLCREQDAGLVVWTFDSLPGKELLTPRALRVGWLLHYGAETVILDSFERVRELSPEAFVGQILDRALGSVACVCGYNYHFGFGGRADASELERLCRRQGILCRTAGEVRGELDGSPVTICSTLIRRLVAEGRLSDAASLLGHPFASCGEVIHGRRFGRTAGMPTANQRPHPHAVLPPDGVYATFCRIDGRYYPAVTNLGCRPTFFGEGERLSETHVLGYSGDLYGKDLAVGYLARIRGERRFDSPEELVREVERNKETARDLFSAQRERLSLPDQL